MTTGQHRLPASTCPACGTEVDGATGLTSDELPKPGDAGICLYCTEIAAYDDDLRLRAPTDDEAEAFAADERIAATRRAIMARRGRPWS